jgi:hypothetical protein
MGVFFQRRTVRMEVAGGDQRLLEIRRATHNLKRSHLVCMRANVHRDAPELR